MSTKTGKRRKGSAAWLAWHVASGARLVQSRVNSAMPWRYKLTTSADGVLLDHDVSASTIAALMEQRVLHAEIDRDGEYAWNRIVYTPGDGMDRFFDALEAA